MASAYPVRYATGEIILEVTDLQSSGYGQSWGHTRSFSSRQSSSETLGNGFNWKVSQWPYLVIQKSMDIPTLGQITTIVAQGNAAETLWFDAVGSEFIARFGLKPTLVHDAPNELYRLTYSDGVVVEFDHGNGAFLRRIGSGGETIEVTAYLSNGFNISTVERIYTDGGQTTTEQFQYEYSTSSGDPLISSVMLRRKINAGGWTNILKANYTYYGYQDPQGGEEDLKTVATQSWTGSAWQDTGTTYYRYYPWFVSGGSSSSGGGGGGSIVNPLNHLLKYVLNPASFARMVADGHNPLTAAELTLALYADHYFEYDPERRVTKEMVQGASQTFLFDYEESGFADGVNAWRTKTTETLPDGNRNVVYCNFGGQPMLQVLMASSPETGDQEWCTFFRYDETHRVILTANPSAVVGYDDELADLLDYDAGSGTYEYLRDNDGLIQVQTYHAPSGYEASRGLKRGQLGTVIKLKEWEYCCCCENCGCDSSSSSSSAGDCASGVWLPSKEIVYPSDVDQNKQVVTVYCYSFHEGTTRVKEKLTTLPAIPIDQNGSGVAATNRAYFDLYGNMTWSMDERGYITRAKYDIPTGAPTQQIGDVDTSVETDHPTGWTTPVDGGLNLVTDYEHDDRGRITQALGPSHTIDIEGTATTIRRAIWMNHLESSSVRTTRQGHGYATGTSPSYTYTLVNPVSISITDLSGKLQQEVQATRASANGKLLQSDTFAQSSYTRWKTLQYTDCCNVASERAYHKIPVSGTGDQTTNYSQTEFGYDVMKRRDRSVTPGGTITRLIFAPRGLVLSTWVGTNDNGGTSTDPSGGGIDPDNNMVLVVENVFDDDVDGGDGNLTRQIRYVSASEIRVTNFAYDWRDRQTDTDGEIDFFQRVIYDSRDRITEIRRYNTSIIGNLIAKSVTLYDDRGRVFREIRYGVNPASGVIGNSLVDNTWYDAAGNKIKILPSGSDLFRKTSFDSLGRAITQYLGYDLDETGHADAETVSDDTILAQTESVYDDASNLIETITRQRYHNAPANQTGPLGTPENNPKARVTYSVTYPDSLGRAQASADYGTNGGSGLSRPPIIPTPCDSILVTLAEYDSAGNSSSTTDPSGMVTRMGYDDLGRVLEQVQNYTPSVSSSSSSSGSCAMSDDVNVTVRMTYNADGNVETLTAVNSATGDQVTVYTYGTTLNESGIATSTLKQKEAYPDSSGENDTIRLAYNRQSQVSTRTDQNGTIHSYDYDLLGRMTQDRVTTLGAGVHGAVRRIETTYDVLGLREKVTSYDNATVGAGSVLNELQAVYNDFGQPIREYQEHGGTVNISTTPSVQYGYADGSENTVRPTFLVYPNGRALTYSYGNSGDSDAAASRVQSILDGDTHLVDYCYLGRDTFVIADDAEPQVKWTLADLTEMNDPDTGDIYSGFDRFGRIKDNRWYNYGAQEDIDRLQYGYDRASNRLWRRNLIAQSLSAEFDELYEYDGIHRVKAMSRGTLNGTATGLSSQTFAQCWTLDSTGNWSSMKEADAGSNWTLQQVRASNSANEITDIANTTGSAWAEPSYDLVGNMTIIPQPNSPTNAYAATYDAWNRLVAIEDGDGTVRTNEYDGIRRRIIQNMYVDGVFSEARQVYFTTRWQVIEERADTSADPSKHFIWGFRYIDDMLLRDRDTDDDGLLDERLYVGQDANWNATVLFNASAAIEERFAYATYGIPICLTPAFDKLPESSPALEFLYCGYHYDHTTGLYNVRHRDLHSAIGYWIQRDLITTLAAINKYQYANSIPTRFTDAAGLFVNSDGAYQECLSECYSDCGIRFPHWWQYNLYIGCTAGCNTGCKGQDFTLCSYVNTWTDCYKDGLQCLCAIPTVLDPIQRINPTVRAIIGAADCACNVMTTLINECAGNSGAATLQLLLAIADCAVDIAGASDIATKDRNMQILNIIIEITLAGVSEVNNAMQPGNVSTPEACCRWLFHCK